MVGVNHTTYLALAGLDIADILGMNPFLLPRLNLTGLMIRSRRIALLIKAATPAPGSAILPYTSLEIDEVLALFENRLRNNSVD